MKRFTETLKWTDPWFRKLKPEIKLLWQWALDNCDSAGVIEPDVELASFQIGYSMSIDSLSELGERVIKLPCGKWHIKKFIEFQYGKNLSLDCKAHNPVFASLLKHNLNGYGKTIDSLQATVKVKDKEAAKETVIRFVKPTMAEIDLQGAKIGLSPSEQQKFWNYYESNGWRVGKNPMKSWVHAMTNWKSNSQSYGRNFPPTPKRSGSIPEATYDSTQ